MTPRLTWTDLDTSLRRRLEELLGEPVVHTHSCRGGFSPSSAEILSGASGRSMFVKAVREQDNPDSPALNRAETTVLEQMPTQAPVPRLVDAFDHGDWFVLVTEAAPGALPQQPWTARQLDQVLAALEALQAATTPCPVAGLPTVPEHLGPDMLGFERVAENLPDDLDPWLAERLDALRAAALRGIDALAGDTLSHSDVRADNMLITDDGDVSLVDWAHASRGSRVSDALQLLSSIDDVDGTLRVNDRVDEVLARHGHPRRMGTDVLVGILGFFVDAARLPHNPTLPLLGEHRRRRRDSLFAIVRERWGGG
ncbi:phosphotransferase [Brachybacterium sp. GCM10030267]|uniref:phosphotransferase n=1 Tax=Brachybacterium sp. GCM10030267 TaxID=3273381 RepID=UPI0036227B24